MSMIAPSSSYSIGAIQSELQSSGQNCGQEPVAGETPASRGGDAAGMAHEDPGTESSCGPCSQDRDGKLRTDQEESTKPTAHPIRTNARVP